MSGYSGTPLARKLGIAAEARVLIANGPEGFDIAGLPPGARVHRRAGRDPYDVILGFCADRAALTRGFDTWRGRLATSGGLWIAWPKKAGGRQTDLGETFVREFGLSTGLVDNKNCAIDEIWSGLRFVIRVADRR